MERNQSKHQNEKKEEEEEEEEKKRKDHAYVVCTSGNSK
jgi:hypothetical protein